MQQRMNRIVRTDPHDQGYHFHWKVIKYMLGHKEFHIKIQNKKDNNMALGHKENIGFGIYISYMLQMDYPAVPTLQSFFSTLE